VIKPWKTRQVKHVARMVEGSNKNPKDRNYLEDNTTMNLKETEWERKSWINLPRDKGTRQSVVEHGNKMSSAIKCREFLD
jgi:hypothetical protein